MSSRDLGSPADLGLDTRPLPWTHVDGTYDLSLLQNEFAGCSQLNINLAEFASRVWGVDLIKGDTILKTTMAFEKGSVDIYKASSSQQRVQLFAAYCDEILRATLEGLGEAPIIPDGRTWTREPKFLRRRPSTPCVEVTVPTSPHFPKDLKSGPTTASGIGNGKRKFNETGGSNIAENQGAKKHCASAYSDDCYVLETLEAVEPHLSTGVFVEDCKLTAYYADRNLLVCAEPFLFDDSPQSLALVLYALNQCFPRGAGFDHFLRPPPSDTPTVMDVVRSYFDFPKAKHFVSRGTNELFEAVNCNTSLPLAHFGSIAASVVARVGHRSDRSQSCEPVIHRLKLFTERWMGSKECRTPKDNLLGLVEGQTPMPLSDLGLPWTRLPPPTTHSSHRTLAPLIIIPRSLEQPWEARSPAEFIQVWLDCVECHYQAFAVGKLLPRALRENSVTILRLAGTKAKGLLCDWDMAGIQRDATLDSIYVARYDPCASPFTAIDLLYGRPWGKLYRYDLESFVYIIVWSMVNWKSQRGTSKVHHVLKGWSIGSLEERGSLKDAFVNSKTSLTRDKIENAIPEGLIPLWTEYVEPLLDLLSDAYNAKFKAQKKQKLSLMEYDYDSCGGTITFHKFMAKIRQKPCWTTVNGA